LITADTSAGANANAKATTKEEAGPSTPLRCAQDDSCFLVIQDDRHLLVDEDDSSVGLR
jgi:hypothetical protein